MYSIYKITSHPVVDFAAEELKKYLRMMMPECGEIFIKYAPEAKDGLRLGLMSDFGLDTSEAEDLFLDDILHIDTDGENGIIAGSNPRSILLAVYRYLRENGCRWLFPGIDGEYIPICDVKPTKYHKMADCRYRGQCNEGAEFQPNMMEAIDFTPKIGMNVFMIEFDNPKAYYDNYYKHAYNTENREPEPVSADTVKQWKRQCEAEITKRGLQFHDMGHGWTAEPFGISSTDGWVHDENNPVPPESREMLAMLSGERKLYTGVALNTQFCMSNPKARTIVAKYITEYARMHQNVDYLHVWLADGSHNHCECDECRKKTPSDWYVTLLNEIDERLTAEKLDTRVVFICYTDTTWAPTVEKLNNKKRFSFMLAAITRTYSTCVPQTLPEIELRPFVLNEQGSFPEKVEEYIAHAKEWWKNNHCPSMVYEYHFWLHQYHDPGTMDFSKLIYDDIRGYKANGFDGLIEDGSQRSYFPNGFNFYVYAETLFDTNVDYEALKRDYFTHAYGELADDVISYLTDITEAFDMRYVMSGTKFIDGGGKKSAGYYNPEHAKKVRTVKDITAKYAPVFEAHKNMPHRAQSVAMKLLRRHIEYCNGLSEVWTLKALGADPEAVKAFEAFRISFGRHEIEIETYFDQRMCFNSLNRVICAPKTFYEAD
ncbi:MAG: DUF4838 domain-containing protein [Clostridia bacterium]|nr:DUF4838 domain-containing protein [Clostridia bacterium]